MAKPRLVILRTGSAPASVQARFGDYVDMFRTQLANDRISVEIADGIDGPLPNIDDVDLAVITGSPHSVTEVQPWVERAAEWSAQLMDRKKPILGVCYGHQLIAYAKGGQVEVNDRGYEIGTVAVELTEAGRADPLLGAVAPSGSMLVQAVHGDTVTKMPDHATLLAGNDISSIQAYSLGDRTWCVQFHPEFSHDVARMYVDERADVVVRRAEALGRDGAVALEAARASVRPSPAGPKLLSRFVDLGLERIR